ncbi:MAG: YheT family hydrolase [Lautropia sp.]
MSQPAFPFDNGAYAAPRWLANRHAQTIWPALVLRGPRLRYRRERWATPDDDFIDLDWAEPAASAGSAAGSAAGITAPAPPPAAPSMIAPPGVPPLVALFHGLEGSSASHYARALMAATLARGWRGVVVHWRGCSGEPNRLARAYHSGDSTEVDWVLRRLRPNFVAGVSLGANALLKWLGEQGSAAGFIQAAAGVSAPQQLRDGAVALRSGFNRVYNWNFLLTMKRKSVAKLARFPDAFDRERMLAARDFFDFDDAVTAPLHGFASAEDYWACSSCRQYLGGIAVPTLVLNALNDPFLPPSALATPAEVGPAVTLDYPKDGGHVGFARGGPPGRIDWLPQRLLGYFARHA